LHKNVEDVAFPVHGLPEVVTCAIEGQKDLIEVPFVARSRLTATQQRGDGFQGFQPSNRL
jgi:hypothetical protein